SSDVVSSSSRLLSDVVPSSSSRLLSDVAPSSSSRLSPDVVPPSSLPSDVVLPSDGPEPVIVESKSSLAVDDSFVIKIEIENKPEIVIDRLRESKASKEAEGPLYVAQWARRIVTTENILSSGGKDHKTWTEWFAAFDPDGQRYARFLAQSSHPALPDKLETVLNLVLDGEREKAPTTDELFFNVCAASPFFPKSPQFKHMASRLKDVYQLIGGLAQIPSPEEACPRLKALKRKFVHMSGETTEALSNPIRTALLQHSEADFAKSMLAILEILDVTWYHAKHMFSHASVSDPTSSLSFCHPVVYVSKQS